MSQLSRRCHWVDSCSYSLQWLPHTILMFLRESLQWKHKDFAIALRNRNRNLYATCKSLNCKKYDSRSLFVQVLPIYVNVT